VAYEAEKIKNGRKPAWLVEITCTSCSLVYGVSPCTAAGAAGSECQNTRGTCQDKPNFAAVDKTYYHANRIIPLPAKVCDHDNDRIEPGGDMDIDASPLLIQSTRVVVATSIS
jgi:hypothetical protein